MGYDAATTERLRAHFAGRADVAEKRMVGGLSFVVNGNMCCGVTGSALMVRVGPDAREAVLADPVGFSTDTALTAWVQRGLDFVETLPAKLNAGGPA